MSKKTESKNTIKKSAKTTSKKVSTNKVKKAIAKKTVNSPVYDKDALAIGNLCIHALALFTNAVITERSDDVVKMEVPFTLAVGKQKTPFRATFGLIPAFVSVKCCDTLTIAEIGECMFQCFCRMVQDSGDFKTPKGTELQALKKYEIVTDYGDRCAYNNGEWTLVKPNPKKKANKR